MKSNNHQAKIAVFLGAGASAFAGYKTFASFPDLIFSGEIRKNEDLGELHNSTLRLLKEVGQSLQIKGKATTHDNFLWALNDYTNLWHVLRVDDVLRSRFLQSTQEWSEFAYFSQAVEDAILDLTTTTVRHYSQNRVEGEQESSNNSLAIFRKLFEFYLALASRNSEQNPYLPVFTTNYDLLMEDLFCRFGNSSSPNFRLVNGFPGCTQEGSIWNCGEYNVNPGGLHFYRLHGCVSWFCNPPLNGSISFHRGKNILYPLSDLCAVYPGNELSIGLDPHAYSFRKLQEVLLKCSIIIFIGFSFRDYDVIHVLLSANAHRKKPLKLITIDSALTEVTIIDRLRTASLKTQYPVRLPGIRDINCINIRFGDNNFGQIICDVANKILNEQGGNHE
jgi:hypothetical protein